MLVSYRLCYVSNHLFCYKWSNSFHNVVIEYLIKVSAHDKMFLQYSFHNLSESKNFLTLESENYVSSKYK